MTVTYAKHPTTGEEIERRAWVDSKGHRKQTFWRAGPDGAFTVRIYPVEGRVSVELGLRDRTTGKVWGWSYSQMPALVDGNVEVVSGRVVV